jgi:hypothetical protein
MAIGENNIIYDSNATVTALVQTLEVATSNNLV